MSGSGTRWFRDALLAGLLLWCCAGPYQPDGERVAVSWGNQEGQRGTYSAKCDGTLESAGGSIKIRCWQAGADRIDGEQLDDSDSLHRYYRRVVSANAKTLSITWYADPMRRRPIERFVYTRK